MALAEKDGHQACWRIGARHRCNSVGSAVQKMFVVQELCLHCGSLGSREFDVIVKEIGSKTTAASTDGSIN
jgi:hypothetical protein